MRCLSSCSSISTLLCIDVKEACAKPRVISGFDVNRPLGLSEETSLAVVESTLNVGVFGKANTGGLLCGVSGVVEEVMDCCIVESMR